MATATLGLSPAAPVSKPDRAAQVRRVWRESYSMSRRMMRPSARYTVGSRFPWTMDALRNRFGASGYAIAQAACRLAFDRATAGRGATGTPAQLQRQGLLGRAGQPLRSCAHVETFLDGRDRFALTVAGVLALREAEAAQLAHA